MNTTFGFAMQHKQEFALAVQAKFRDFALQKLLLLLAFTNHRA
jgi:hypothetical protein